MCLSGFVSSYQIQTGETLQLSGIRCAKKEPRLRTGVPFFRLENDL
jgi:hypothetical protein